MIRALLVCLALYGTARAEAPICPIGQHLVPICTGFTGCGWPPQAGEPNTEQICADWPDDPRILAQRLDRIEATLKALCEHSGAICPKETRP